MSQIGSYLLFQKTNMMEAKIKINSSWIMKMVMQQRDTIPQVKHP